MNIWLKRLVYCQLAIAVSFPITTVAELHDRGGGLIYDDALDVTWLQDTNYAQTSGYDSDGQMTYAEAQAWVDNLSYYDSVRDVTYDDWRLPAATDIGSDGATYTNYYQGVDYGFNITTHSDLSHMFYENLQNTAAYTTTGFSTGCDSNAPSYCLTNTGPFVNLRADRYWTGQQYGTDVGRNFIFYFNQGAQQYTDHGNVEYAWAVRNGDVSSATDLIVELINSAIALNLNRGIENSLDAKLDRGLRALEDANTNNDVSAINALNAFIGETEAQRGIQIDIEDADALIADAEYIIGLLTV